MEIEAKRTACFAGEVVALEADSDGPGGVRWTGGGAPASGEGRGFRTVYSEGGTYTVRAERGEETAEVEITVCPMQEWLERAADFFGPALDLGRVRVIGSRWVLGPRGSAWTCNTVVRFRRPIRAEDLPSEATLIHELGHVWEHRAGQTQLLSGLLEQMGRRFRRRDPYDYGGPAGVRSAESLTRFSKESQAQIISELWKAEHGHRTDRKNVEFTSEGYLDDLRRLVRGAGIGTADPTRRTFGGAIDSWIARSANLVLARFE